MDIGHIVIHLAGGKATVSRCDETPAGVRLTPATNAADLSSQAERVLRAQDVSLNDDGIYLCSDDLQAAAQFPPLQLPADAITYGTARQLLYPDVSANTGWQRIRALVEQRRLRVWRVGIAQETRRYVSRAQVMQLVDELATAATV